MTTVTIQDQTLHGNIVHELFFKFSTQRISAADLIAARVRKEVAQYNQRANDHLHFLVQPDERETVLNGYDQSKPKKSLTPTNKLPSHFKYLNKMDFLFSPTTANWKHWTKPCIRQKSLCRCGQCLLLRAVSFR